MWRRILSVVTAVATAITLLPCPAPVAVKADTKAYSTGADYYWDFENLSGDKFSNMGTAQAGEAILKGTATTETDRITVGGKNYKEEGNQVLVLSGGAKGSSYVELPENLYQGISAGTGFSYSFWLKPDSSIGNYSRVISSADSDSKNEFAFAPYASDKVWNVLFDDTDVVYAPMSAEPVKGEWSFVVFTVSAEEIVFYINGEEIGSFANSANLTKRLGSMGSLVKNALGRTYSTWSDPDAKVKLDDVSLYKKVLTQGDVVSLTKEQGLEVESKTEAGGANELTDGTAVTDTGLDVSFRDITAKIVTDKETGRYFITASHSGNVLLDASQLGLKASSDFTQGLSYVEGSAKTVSGTDSYTLTTGAKREISDEYQELSFQLQNTENRVMTVYIRIYEDGAAWRYELSGTAGQTEAVGGEASEFVLPSDSYIWAGYDVAGNYEYEYQKIKMSSVKAATAKYSVPLLANSGDNWMLFTEASVFSEEDTWCASHLATSAGTRNLKFQFGKGSGSTLSMTYNKAGILHTPWRVAILADNLNDIVNATMSSSLNPEPDKTLYAGSDSWIKTGTVAWSWWSEAGDDPIEFDQQKDYIDFAAENGWEYVCLDFGWCLWKNYKDKVKELVDYGESKGVGILLWYGVNNDNHTGSKDAEGDPAYPKYSLKTAKQLEEQFAWCESVGVKGVKVDYYENDDKNTMTLMYHCATIAAKHKINVLFHGCTAPRGEIRTFPNVLGYEAVRGSEYYKWNVGPSISNCLTYVYNRNVVGGMDFTPVGTQIDQLPVTAGFQLAQVVAYQTGLQNIASSVYKLEGYQGLSMINDVPAQWDETLLLGGYPGKDITIARRNQENWYVAAMTAASKEEKVALDFLGEGSYRAYVYSDNADGTDVQIEETEVTKDSILSLKLGENGGAVVKLTKEAMKTETVYDSYTYYEAENAGNVLGGNASIGKNQFASGMEQVVSLGGTAYNTVTFQGITVPEDGVYEMRLYYACGVERRVVYTVNGEKEIRSKKLNAGVNTLAMEKFYVRLQKGANSISFGNTEAKAPNIDRIAISKQTSTEPETVTDLTDDGDQKVDGTQYDYDLYDARAAVLAGGAVIEGDAIGWLGNGAASTATFRVNVDEVGNYKLQINYFAGESRKVYVSVNSGEKIYHTCPSTGSYTMDSLDCIYVDVSLQKGENTICLGNESEWCPNIASIGVSKTVVPGGEDDEMKAPSKIVVKAKGYDLARITLLVGKKVKLAVSVSPKAAEQDVVFQSSKKSVATVNSAGVVQAKKAGKTKITIATKDGTKKKTITIQVAGKKKVNRILLLKKNKAVLKTKAQSIQIAIQKLTKNTTDTISYKVISGKKYVKVDAYGKVTVKNFVKGKSAVITVRCGKVSKTIKVTLKK